MPKIIKECKTHGTVEYVLEKRGYYRCKKCRTENVSASRIKRKLKLIQHFGGKCQVCGYDRCQQALQFHHNDPESKEFGISASGLCKSWDKMLAEAKKCTLLCANCHAEVENGIITI